MGKINTSHIFSIEKKEASGNWKNIIEFQVEDALCACKVLDAYKALYAKQTLRLTMTLGHSPIKNLIDAFSRKQNPKDNVDKIYKHHMAKAREEWPNAPFKQIQEIRKLENAKYEFLSLIDVAHNYLLQESHCTIDVDSEEIELLYRSMEDLASYLGPLDPGVYRYNLSNIRTLTEEIIHRIEDKKAKPSVTN